MKHFNLVKYAAICALLACANPKNRKQYIEALENQVFENNVNLSQRPGQTVEIRDQSGTIKKTPLIDKDGDGVAEGLDLDGDGVIDVKVMKGRHKKETAEKFTMEIDINGDGNTDYYFAVEKTATGYRITLVAAASTGSQQLTLLQTNDVITGIDSTGDNVSDDNRLNGKNCTNTGSGPADSTAPSVPSSLTATAAGQTQVNLTWTASTDNTTPTGNLVYEICQSTTAGGCDNFSVTFNSAAGATAYFVTNLSPLTAYYYRIRARDIAANRSATTGEQSATTQSAGTVANPTFSPTAGFFAAVQNVSFSSTTTGVTFCSTTNGSAPTCNVEGGCQSGTPGASVSVTTTATVKAVACRSGYSASAEISGTYTIDSVSPTAPPSPSAGAAGSDQVQLNWSAASDNTSSAANLVYEICQSTTAGGCDIFSVTYTTGAGATSYLIGSLTPITTYYFRIRSKDQAGNSGTPTAEQTATTTTTGTVSAPAFSPVAGTYNAGQNVTITSATSGALICYTTNGSTPTCNTTPTCTTGTAYGSAVTIASTATLRAIGCKAAMTNSSVTVGTFTIDTTPPANVTGLTATAGSSQVSLSWTNPGDADFAGTKILRKTGGYPTDQNDGTVVYNSTGTSYTDTGLTGGIQYYYKVFAYDAAANYALSAQVTATPLTPGSPLMAQSPSIPTNYTYIRSCSIDANGNIYGAGNQNGMFAFLTKIGSSGTIEWSKSITGNDNIFMKTALDPSSNILVAGYVSEGTTYTFGPGITLTGSGAAMSEAPSAALVKYDQNGNALWARTTISGVESRFESLKVTPSGDIFAVGQITNNQSYNFGSGVTVAGTASSFINPVIVKYNSSGNALWARSTSSTACNGGAYYSDVSIDNMGNAIAVGRLYGNTSCGFASGISVVGLRSGGVPTLLLVKYDSSGNVLWAKAPQAAGGSSYLEGVSFTSSGDIIAVGGLGGSSATYNFGNSVSLTATSASQNMLVIKYSSSGDAVWAKSTVNGNMASMLNSISIDDSDNIFVAGNLQTTSTLTFTNGISVAGSSTLLNVLIGRMNTSGDAQWLRSTTSGPNESSLYYSVNANSAGQLCAAGYQNGTTAYTYGTGISATGQFTGGNGLIVKYAK